MRGIRGLYCCLLCGVLTLSLYSCAGVVDLGDGSAASDTGTEFKPVSSVFEQSAVVGEEVLSSHAEVIQPDPEHPFTEEGYELIVANYDAAYLAYNRADKQMPRLYIALTASNRFMPGLPNEVIEGSAVLLQGDCAGVSLVVERPHDGGTVEGIRISFVYDAMQDSVSSISIEEFTGADGTCYTLDYSGQSGLEAGRLLYHIMTAAEEYIVVNAVK